MRFIVLGLAALSIFGCRTHTVDTCLPPCTDADEVAFAECVASGGNDPMGLGCEPGNRRCCALAAGCIGELDDQEVVTTQTMCGAAIVEDQCWPPCDSVDEEEYAICLDDGSSACSPDDEACCALDANCLGPLADWEISAEGCCSVPEDCASDETCDQAMWMCVLSTGPRCGDGNIDAGETCDDSNQVTESCDYGLMSCEVCSSACVLERGATSFCGDSVIDAANEEACDPPGRLCDTACQLALPDTCSNGSQDGDETDDDCGGSCAPCFPDQNCRAATDCTILPESAICGATPFCDIATGLGVCMERYACDDSNVCTADTCEPGVGCASSRIDFDGDGFGPDPRCGNDCNDFDRNVNPGVSFDIVCDGFDDDCDTFIDEDC